MNNLILNLPINSTSFGNVSLLILRQIFEQEQKRIKDPERKKEFEFIASIHEREREN